MSSLETHPLTTITKKSWLTQESSCQLAKPLKHFGIVDGDPVPECVGLISLRTFEVSTNRKANGEWCTREEVSSLTF